MLVNKWAGRFWGTNVGNVYLTTEGLDTSLSGSLKLNDEALGLAVYSVHGTFDGTKLSLSGEPQDSTNHAEFGNLKIVGVMNSKGEIDGDWQSTIGTAGTFKLFPHIGTNQNNEPQIVEQRHTARHNFGAIEIDKIQIVEIGERIKRDFPSVVITVVSGTEQARYLEDFKNHEFSNDRADVITIFAQRPDRFGMHQSITIEFGPIYNTAMAQGTNEAWVLGQLETLKRDLKQHERAHISAFIRLGINFNQLMLLATVVYLPSLNGLKDRAILMSVVLALLSGVSWLHPKLVPNAAIYLRNRKKHWFQKLWLGFVSWGLGILAASAATLVGAYLEGAIKIPLPPSALEQPTKK
jgi:hypothetical protein